VYVRYINFGRSTNFERSTLLLNQSRKVAYHQVRMSHECLNGIRWSYDSLYYSRILRYSIVEKCVECDYRNLYMANKKVAAFLWQN